MRTFAALSLCGIVAEAQNSGIKKVITLLGDLKGKVESETAQGKQDAADYEDWCIKTITETKADIKYGAEKVEENQAKAEDGAAKSQAGKATVGSLALEIAKAQKAQKTAAAVRKEDHGVFNGKESELVEADAMLGKAYSVLKRSLSFAQGGNAVDVRTEEVVEALGAIIASAAAGGPEVRELTSFLEDGQPQASVKAYESKSGGILTTIQNMQDKNAQVLAQLRDAEMHARHDFEMLMQDLKNTEQSKSDQMDAAKEAAAKAEADGKAAEAAAAEASEVLAADKTELADTQQGCDAAAAEWSARLSEATEEIQVLGQAMEILEGKFGSTALLQTKVTTSSDFQKREKVSTMLRKMGREYNQYGLMQVAQAANDDPFVKVRGMINDMVAKLEEEARKEAGKEAKCKQDKQKGQTDLKIKKGDFEKLGSRLDGSNAKFVLLGDEIADLQQQLKDLDVSVRAATDFRGKDRKDNNAVIADAGESVEALSSAISVLTDFYGESAPALLQVGSKKQSDSANVIMSILQTAQEDFEKLKQDTEAAEASAQSKYEKDMQAADVSKAKKTAMVEAKTAERSTVKVMISQISEDLANATKAYDAAKDFLKGVMEACANKAMSFEERQARREAEIAGLKDALEILSPEAEFVQTRSFLAKGSQ